MAILEFVIALFFCYLLISLFVSWIIDIYANRSNRKGRFLEKMLARLVGHDESVNWAVRLYKHPMIETLSYKRSRLTSYISAETFSHVLTDLIIEEGREYTFEQDKKTKRVKFKEDDAIEFMKDIKKGLAKLDESDLKRTIKLFYEKAGTNSTVFLSSIEKWFNDYMLRVNYAYKRLLRMPLWLMGFIIAFAFNVDVLRITNELWDDAKMRHEVAGAAEEFIERYDSLDQVELTKEFFEEYKTSLSLPVGWKYEKEQEFVPAKTSSNKIKYKYGLRKLLGFILTGIVASFGAPFWYEALQKAVGLKRSMKIKTE